MPKGEWGSCRHQIHNTKKPSIENLKNRLADNNCSPVMFFHDHFRKHSHMTYDEFLELINYWEVISDDLQNAIDDFWKVSV